MDIEFYLFLGELLKKRDESKYFKFELLYAQAKLHH
jgi:hypothetical protein